MRISDFIDAMSGLDNPDSMLVLLERAAADLGFDRYAYCALSGHERYDAGDNPPPAVALNFPESWTDYYFEHDCQAIDPVVYFTPAIDRPFLWERLGDYFRLSAAQHTLLDQASEAKLRDGVAIPLHGPRCGVCLMTFAASDGHPDPAAAAPMLNALATQFHVSYSAVGRIEPYRPIVARLSARERECLQQIALGKSLWDISTALKISENTVRYYLKNAFRKLGAHNRLEAVVIAVGSGEISLESGAFNNGSHVHP